MRHHSEMHRKMRTRNLALLAVLPAAAQQHKDGRYTAVTIDDEGVKWKIQLNVKGKNI